jgi:hypothetical protein
MWRAPQKARHGLIKSQQDGLGHKPRCKGRYAAQNASTASCKVHHTTAHAPSKLHFFRMKKKEKMSGNVPKLGAMIDKAFSIPSFFHFRFKYNEVQIALTCPFYSMFYAHGTKHQMLVKANLTGASLMTFLSC